MCNSRPRPRGIRLNTACPAFTFIELLVVAGTIAMLIALLIPTLGATKGDVMLAQCRNNLQRLGTGFSLFTQDRNEMFPPAGLDTSFSQLTWDTYIHRYIGGTTADKWLTSGVIPIELVPGILHCPTDAPGRLSKVEWMGNPPWNGLRTYEMVAITPPYSSQVHAYTGGGYVFPPLQSLPGQMGVGIWWSGFPSLDWDAPGYKTSVVKDPAGTIMLVELPNSIGAAGNIWPCFSEGPSSSASAPWSAMYQLRYPEAASFSLTGGAVSQGWDTYRAHGQRFNYLFHDNHVEPLSVEQTVGTGTTNYPNGMWTVNMGD